MKMYLNISQTKLNAQKNYKHSLKVHVVLNHLSIMENLLYELFLDV